MNAAECKNSDRGYLNVQIGIHSPFTSFSNGNKILRDLLMWIDITVFIGVPVEKHRYTALVEKQIFFFKQPQTIHCNQLKKVSNNRRPLKFWFETAAEKVAYSKGTCSESTCSSSQLT